MQSLVSADGGSIWLVTAIAALLLSPYIIANNDLLVNRELRLRNARQVGQIARCDFDCIHGRCNSTTRNCMCHEGWRGAACDICEHNRLCDWSVQKQRITMLLPQGTPVNIGDTLAYVYAHGQGFRRGLTARYACIFNSIRKNNTAQSQLMPLIFTTTGEWLSNAVVRCRQPNNAPPGRYIFNMAPLNNASLLMAKEITFNAVDILPYGKDTTPIFTFYTKCDTASCEGICLGARCLCASTRSGRFCKVPAISTSPRLTTTLDNAEADVAEEFRPFILKLHTETTCSRITIIESDISTNKEINDTSLIIDHFERTVTWRRPLGFSPSPYMTKFDVDNCCQTSSSVIWKLTVVPTYTPTLKAYKVCDEFHNSNGIVIMGEILPLHQINGVALTVHNDTKILDRLFAGNGRVPLTIRVSDAEGEQRIREHRQIHVVARHVPNESAYRYEYKLYPYADGGFLTMIKHPGIQDNTLNKSVILNVMSADDVFTVRPVGDIDEKIRIYMADGVGVQRYAIKRDSASNVTRDCFRISRNMSNDNGEVTIKSDKPPKWHVELLEPREALLIDVVNEKNIDEIEIRFRVQHADLIKDSVPLVPDSSLKLVFKCAHNFVTVEQFINVEPPPSLLMTLKPTKLVETIVDCEDSTDSCMAPAIHALNINLRHVPPGVNVDALLNASDFMPFRRVWGDLTRWNAGRTRVWLTLDELNSAAPSAGVHNGELHLPNASNHILTVPYQIRRKSALNDDFSLTLTLHCPADGDSADALNNSIDVELYSTNRVQHVVRTVQLNIPTVVSSLRADYFQVKLKSSEFLPVSTVVKLSEASSALEINLERVGARPRVIIDDNGVVCARFGNLSTLADKACLEEMENNQPLNAPTLSVWPSTFRDNGSDATIHYADFVFSAPHFGTYAILSKFTEELQTANGTPFDISFEDKSLPAICSGCGYRLAFRVRRNSSALSGEIARRRCNIFRFRLPYTYTLSHTPTQSYNSATYIIMDTRVSELVRGDVDTPVVCSDGTSDGASSAAMRTPFVVSCTETRLAACRVMYQPATVCDKFWRNVAASDRAFTIENYAQFLLFSANCRVAGVDFRRLIDFIACIENVDTYCPTSFPGEAPRSAIVEPSLNEAGHIFSPVTSARSLQLGIQTSFTIQGAVESQLANFPQLLRAFLQQLDSLFPYEEMVSVVGKDDAKWIETFVSVIADKSDDGAHITDHELDCFNGWRRGEKLVTRWNAMYEALRGDDLDLQFPILRADVRDFIDLTQRVTRLRALTRQFGGENPFKMLHDILRKIYANINSKRAVKESNGDDTPIGAGFVRIEPDELREGEETQIFVTLHNSQSVELRNVRLSVEFGSVAGLKYRLGPIFYVGMTSLDAVDSVLAPNATLEARWVAVPIPEFRLMHNVVDTPRVVLSFVHSGRRKIQRLNAPTMRIRARISLRVLAIAFPTFQASARRHPFSISIAIMNSGYSKLNSVELVELRIRALAAGTTSTAKTTATAVARGVRNIRQKRSRTLNYRIDGVRLDENMYEDFVVDDAPVSSWRIGSIDSGAQRNLAFNLTTESNEEAFLSNVSMVFLADGEVPAQLDYRLFFVHDTVGDDNNRFLITDTQLPYPLYFYDRATSKLVTLNSLQLIQEKHVEQEVEGHRFWTVFAVYRLLDALPKRDSGRGISVFGQLRVPISGYFREGNATRSLVRVAEVVDGPSQLQRHVDARNIWTSDNEDDVSGASPIDEQLRTIKFVDVRAAVNAPNAQLFYEFFFGDAQFLELPYFTHATFTINVIPTLLQDIAISVKSAAENTTTPIIVARLQAFTPTRSTLNYTLLSRREYSPLQVVPDTGEIVLFVTPAFPPTSLDGYCVNLVASDGSGRQAVVPLNISLAGANGQRINKYICERYPPSMATNLYRHTYHGDRSTLMSIAELERTPSQQQKEQKQQELEQQMRNIEQLKTQQEQQSRHQILKGAQQQQIATWTVDNATLSHSMAEVTADMLLITVTTTTAKAITVQTDVTPVRSTLRNHNFLLTNATIHITTSIPEVITAVASTTIRTEQQSDDEANKMRTVSVESTIQAISTIENIVSMFLTLQPVANMRTMTTFPTSLPLNSTTQTTYTSTGETITVRSPTEIFHAAESVTMQSADVVTKDYVAPDVMLSSRPPIVKSPVTMTQFATPAVTVASTITQLVSNNIEAADWGKYTVIGGSTLSPDSEILVEKLPTKQRTANKVTSARTEFRGGMSGTWTAEKGEASLTDAQSAAAMVDMACRQRGKRAIWAVICDMAKTVFRTFR